MQLIYERPLRPAANHDEPWVARVSAQLLADLVLASRHPGLTALSARMEALPAFVSWPPVGPGLQASNKV